jgi:hypothetical protein
LKVSLENIISMVVKEVIAELTKKGINVDSEINSSTQINFKKEKTEIKFDMSGFKTPILTEENILNLEGSITTIIVPTKTIITPNARDLIRKRKLIIITKNKE